MDVDQSASSIEQFMGPSEPNQIDLVSELVHNQRLNNNNQSSFDPDKLSPNWLATSSGHTMNQLWSNQTEMSGTFTRDDSHPHSVASDKPEI